MEETAGGLGESRVSGNCSGTVLCWRVADSPRPHPLKGATGTGAQAPQEQVGVSCPLWVGQGQNSWRIGPLKTASPAFQGLVQGHTAAGWLLEAKAPRRSASRSPGERAQSSILWQAQTGQYRSERTVLSLCLPRIEPSFLFERRAKVIYTLGGRAVGGAGTWGRRSGRSGLTCFPPPRLGGEEPRTQPVDSRAADRPTLAGTFQGPWGRGAEDGEIENPNLERGVTWGPGAGPPAGRRERAGVRWPRKRRAPPTHPGRERCGQRQAGPGAVGPRPPP